MKEITISLTDEQEEFLMLFAKNHFPGSKQNLCTTNPIHLVQTQRERIIDPDYSDGDNIKYYVSDWDYTAYNSPQELIKAYYEDKECPIKIVSFDEAYGKDRFIDVDGENQVILDEEDYLRAYGIDDDFYIKAHIEYYYETVAYFFILEEAKKYIEYQGHNLTNPRTYTVGAGYANKGEYHHFWELLYSLGVKLNESK